MYYKNMNGNINVDGHIYQIDYIYTNKAIDLQLQNCAAINTKISLNLRLGD